MNLTQAQRPLLEDVLASPALARLLVHFAVHPDDAVHVRELQRLTGLGMASLQTELRRLVRLGVLSRRARGNRVEYRLETGHRRWQPLRALIRNAGYRLRSTPGGHHYVAFATLAALGPPELTRIAEEMNRLRRRRHDAVYDWHDREEGDELAADELDRIVSELLRAGLETLLQSRPRLASVLARV